MGPAAWDQGNSRKHLMDAIDASLRRLDTEYVDLYQLHMDDSATPIDGWVSFSCTANVSWKSFRLFLLCR